MKIRLYIVTYKRNEVLNENLRTLWASASAEAFDKVTVLANHPSVEIDAENQRPNLSVVVNEARMPHAWGNLSKDWNYGLLDGFRMWNNPDGVDWVVLAQNDVTWKPGWTERLAGMKDLLLITQPRGDQAIALQIEAVRRIGFFDERFPILAYQEVDYFMRAALQLGEQASINDDHAGELSAWNPRECFMINYTFSGANENENLHTSRYVDEMGGFFMRKWGLRRGSEIHRLADLMKRRSEFLARLPEEICWYPFFWDKCPSMPISLRWYGGLAAWARNPNPDGPIRERFDRYRNGLTRRINYIFHKVKYFSRWLLRNIGIHV